MSAEKMRDCCKPLPPIWKTTPDPLGFSRQMPEKGQEHILGALGGKGGFKHGRRDWGDGEG